MEPNTTLRPWRLGPNEHLIGDEHGRAKLNTPALIIDIDLLESNLARMARLATRSGVALRPHTKCHKSVEIAQRQIKAGAQGICCATIGEAEVMAAGGVNDILITSPIVEDQKMRRAAAILARGIKLTLVIDSPVVARQMSDVFAASGVVATLLIDVDPGMGRTGVANQRLALDLVREVERLEGVCFGGLQCYAGHIQYKEQADKREEANLSVLGSLKVLCEEIKTMGLSVSQVSGGGTGTHDTDFESRVLTEVQAGSYVFMDCQYNQLWEAVGEVPPFQTSLLIQTTVISSNQKGAVTCDAGFKHFAVDGGVPVPITGVDAGANYIYAGDEFGVIRDLGAHDIALGQKVELIVPHCDPTVNLYNFYHCVRGQKLVDIWPVDARGA